MPPRRNPTARQERLGAELRKLREQAGLSGREAAHAVGLDQAKLSHLEAGRVAVGAERARDLASHYGCTDAALVDGLAAMAAERVRGWWEEFRAVLPQGFLDLAELEHHASSLRAVEITQIPGLLQIEDHAAALFENAVSAPRREQIDARVEFRMSRQQVLDRCPPVPLEVVLHEAALRIRVAGRDTARAQLRALAEASERESLSLRVVPFEADGFAHADYSMLYADGPVEQLDTVHLDAVHGGVLLTEVPELEQHRELYRRVGEHALRPADSRSFIRKVAQEM